MPPSPIRRSASKISWCAAIFLFLCLAACKEDDTPDAGPGDGASPADGALTDGAPPTDTIIPSIEPRYAETEAAIDAAVSAFNQALAAGTLLDAYAAAAAAMEDSPEVTRVDHSVDEQGNVQFRRSLYWVRDLEAGEVVTPDAVRSVRPGHGLPPKRLDDLIGRTLARPVRAKTATCEEDLAG